MLYNNIKALLHVTDLNRNVILHDVTIMLHESMFIIQIVLLLSYVIEKNKSQLAMITTHMTRTNNTAIIMHSTIIIM